MNFSAPAILQIRVVLLLWKGIPEWRATLPFRRIDYVIGYSRIIFPSSRQKSYSIIIFPYFIP